MKQILVSLSCACLALPVHAEEFHLYPDVSASMNLGRGLVNVERPERRIDQVQLAMKHTLEHWPFPDEPTVVQWGEDPFRLPYRTTEELVTVFGSPFSFTYGNTYLGTALKYEALEPCSHYVILTDEYPDDDKLFEQILPGLLMSSTVSVFVLKSVAQGDALKSFRTAASGDRYFVLRLNTERDVLRHLHWLRENETGCTQIGL